MRRYLLDSGPAGDFMHARGNVRERAEAALRRGVRIGIAVPVLGELWFGVEFSSSRDRNVHRLRRMVADLVVWPFTDEAAEEFGRLTAELRRLGRPMQQIDIQIAAIALTLGRTTVVSYDSDLAAVPGLAVEDWTRPS